jgi:putative membrane protein
MSWGGWSIETPLLYVVAAGLLYWAGGRGRRPRPGDGLRTASFIGGLTTIVLALDSPIDEAADQLFWAHMAQHVLLLTVAPPLILLGRPWPRMWRALPLTWRTRLGRGIARGRVGKPLRELAKPWPAFVLFNATIVIWHIPALYNATLTSSAVHQLEHAMFFFTGLLFWARVIDPGPLRPRMVWPARIAYAVGAMIVSWALAVVLVIAPHPVYAHYADLASRPGGISALTDQQLAGGTMWVLGSIAYSIAAIYGFYRWLEPETNNPSPMPALRT